MKEELSYCRPKELVLDKTISGSDLLVYSAIACIDQETGSTGMINVPTSVLHKLARVSKATLRKSLKTLEEKQWVKVEHNIGEVSTYKIAYKKGEF